MKRLACLISCEHAGNRVPRRFREYFEGFDALLQSHRGFDAGALATARKLAQALQCRLIFATTSRLVIDLNRSIGHPGLYSSITRDCPPRVKNEILCSCYYPYRGKIDEQVLQSVADNSRLIHISSHSFTPVLEGNERNADVGLLYDPGRAGERTLCRLWAERLKGLDPEISVRKNYPYRGVSDGLTSFLRKRHPDQDYLGIELEVNQKLQSSKAWNSRQQAIVESLCAAIRDFGRD